MRSPTAISNSSVTRPSRSRLTSITACLISVFGGELEQLVDAVGTRVAVVAKLHRRPPGHRGWYDLVAVLLVQVGEEPERGGLAGARRPQLGQPAPWHRGLAAIASGSGDTRHEPSALRQAL